MGVEAPSGLFPTGPPRPAYREPHPVRARGLLGGLAAGAAWMVLFGLLGTDLRSHLWWLIGAGAAAWVVALGLAKYGDRGAAAGTTLAAGAGWTVAGGLIALYWSVSGDFPLW